MRHRNDLRDKLSYDMMREELDAILGWWSSWMIDFARGGFYGRRDNNNLLVDSADKGVILNTRILWAFSESSRIRSSDKYHRIAERAYQYIKAHFIDPEHGGVYWMLNAAGKPVNTRKQIYAQAFAVYSLAAYHRLTGDEQVLHEAIGIFDCIESNALDRRLGGYLDAFDRMWQPIPDQRLSEKDLNASKTMNTHLHLLEAYTSLYLISDEPRVEEALRRLIDLMTTRFIGSGGHLNLFFDTQWGSLSEVISFGHDIECSWLLTEAAGVLKDPDLIESCRKVASMMASNVFAAGLCHDGSLQNERIGQHYDSERHWWVQAEAVIGFWNAWEITGDERMKNASTGMWEFIVTRIKDMTHGEWHWGIDGTGNVLTLDKAGPWKAPYHNSRMCMEMMHRLSPQV